MTPNLLSEHKIVLIPTLAVLFLALFPQIFLILGGRWNGSYFVSNYDETAYSAYVNALVNGKPRKNDPFLGLADSAETPQPETLYSIQFVPSYAIALPARVLGVNVSTAFILLAALIAVLSVFASYGFLLKTTGDPSVAAIGPLVVLCLGTAVAFQGELRNLIEGRVLADFFPFLRRYQPGLSFPLFFVFCLFVWKAVRSESVKWVAVFSAVAGAVFAVLVFSYFYLWTAAAAWLVCFAIVYFVLNKRDLKKSIMSVTIIAAIGGAALIPYFYLLSLRSSNLDSVQLLAFTRTPEFASPSMLVGLVLAFAAVFILHGRGDQTSGKLPMILSFALTPVILFNQQVITGRSLQPVHYELFIANYLVLTGAMLLLAAWRAGDSTDWAMLPGFRRGLLYLGIAAFIWGLFEAWGSTSRNLTAAEIRDASVPAVFAAVTDAKTVPTVLATNFVTADFIPSIKAARSLWNPHTSSAGGIGVEENKRLFYIYLYFSGYTERDLDAALKVNSFEVTAAIFGSERALPSLAGGSEKITAEEIKAEAAKFAEFSKSIGSETAYNPAIDYIIVPAEAEPNFANLDRWYIRDEGKPFGLFKLYKLTRKPGER